jgi:magnesium-transporting ATPase (P-type)
MTHSSAVFGLGSEFDNFLFAPIGEDRNGMLLSARPERIGAWKTIPAAELVPGDVI